MFETVVPDAVVPRSRRLFYEVLPLSLALHAAAVAALIGGAIWNVVFPEHSPKLYAAYSLLAVPPPPPPPPPPAAPKRAEAVAPKAVPEKMPFVAPNVIPDTIPVVEPEVVAETVAVAAPVEGDGGGGEPSDSQYGVEGGERGGEAVGTLGGVAVPLPAPAVVEVPRDEPLPVESVDQTFPNYPEHLRTRGIEGTLVVRYRIGKDGRVKDTSIVLPPEQREFAEETLSAMRHWRFRPYRDASGELKEMAHELTVEFRIAWKKKRGP
jgi:protein TonB